MVNENDKPTGDLPVEEVTGAEPARAVEPHEWDAHCPNCNAPGIRKGKVIICQVCNASFRWTKEGPKVEELGPFDELAARVTALEGGKQPLPEPSGKQPAEPAEPQPAEPAKAQPAEPSDDDGI